MNKRYKDSLENVFINNRWRQKKYMRNGSWVIFGFSKSFFSPNKYEWRIHLFGIDIRFWMNREFIN